MYTEFMALTDDDLKKIGKLITINVGEALEQIVFPELQKIEKSIVKLDQKVDGVEERLGKRIDKIAEITTETKSNHEKRIRTLENELEIEPAEVLTI